MRAFLSYQTEDRHVAAEVGAFLASIAVPAFMAHENIDVSHEWQGVILGELAEADIFIAILSQRYHASAYCLQESGIAVFRQIGAIIPLSIDGSIPPGFMAHIQSRRIEPGKVSHAVLFAGIAKYDRDFAIECMLNRLGGSRSWDGAGHSMDLLKPYLKDASEAQLVEVLKIARMNGEVAYSFGCGETLRELFESHGHLLEERDQSHLQNVLNPR